VFPIEMPPLRDRKEDIPLLLEYFMDRGQRPGRRARGIHPRTLDLHHAYSWPGNIRELQKVVERALIVSSEEELTVDARWFPELSIEPPRQPLSNEPADAMPVAETSLAELERQTIIQTLAAVGGNRRLAAARLGIGLRTLYEKLKRYGIHSSPLDR
jgi:DNA-binding NtrC family response regulator